MEEEVIPTFYVRQDKRHEVMIFANIGCGYFPMYGPFDGEARWGIYEVERWTTALKRWGYTEVDAPKQG